VSYLCNCTTTVDAGSGACVVVGWATTDTFTETCKNTSGLLHGTFMMMTGEVVAALLVVIMFGNLIKSSERIGALMQAARDRFDRARRLAWMRRAVEYP